MVQFVFWIDYLDLCRYIYTVSQILLLHFAVVLDFRVHQKKSMLIGNVDIMSKSSRSLWWADQFEPCFNTGKTIFSFWYIASTQLVLLYMSQESYNKPFDFTSSQLDRIALQYKSLSTIEFVTFWPLFSRKDKEFAVQEKNIARMGGIFVPKDLGCFDKPT